MDWVSMFISVSQVTSDKSSSFNDKAIDDSPLTVTAIITMISSDCGIFAV